MWKDSDLETVHGDDVGRGCCSWQPGGEGGGEFGVVVGDENSDAESSEDEESCEAIEDGIVGFGEDDSRVFGFACGHGDVVGTGDDKGGLDETLEETEKIGQVGFAGNSRDFGI